MKHLYRRNVLKLGAGMALGGALADPTQSLLAFAKLTGDSARLHC